MITTAKHALVPRTLLALALFAPLLASAQAYRCQDAASGRTLYTDQPCNGGATVVPKPTDEQLRQDAERAQQARERAVQQREDAVLRQQQQLDADRTAEALRPRPVPPAESEACRRARAEASFRAASFAASQEEIRTARYNAALACGQQPPADIVVVEPPAPAWPVHRPRRPWVDRPPPGFGGGDGLGAPHRPARPRHEPGTEPIPVKVR